MVCVDMHKCALHYSSYDLEVDIGAQQLYD